MTKNSSANGSHESWRLALAYGLWLVLAALSGVVIWQVYGSLIYLSTIWLSNPEWRPLAWNTHTISGLARFIAILIGILWLGFVTFMERYLRISDDWRDLWLKAARLTAFLALLFILSYLVFWIV